MHELNSSTSPIAITAYDGPPVEDLYCDARDYEPDLHWNYVAKGILCRGETSILYGPSNCGKSALVGHLGHCIITGAPFFGAKVYKGAVIHVCAEAPKSVLERVHAYHDDDTAAPYIIRTAGVDLSSTHEVARFLAEAKRLASSCAHEVVLIVFDTLARSIGTMDENCSSSMTCIAETAEQIAAELDAHVMLVHHTGKDVDRGGRGSSALRGAVSTELALKPDGTVVVLSQEKQRTMPKAQSVQFKTVPVILGKDEDGDDRTTVHVAELDGKVETARNGRHEKSGAACVTAVQTALHIRAMNGARLQETFRPREILDTLPPELFGKSVMESRIRRVSRALEELAGRPRPVVEKDDEGWRLASPQAVKSGSEDGSGTSALH